ncbi:unnamed protein product [Rangifer tarandus platyrhynchus]|uniref:MROH2B-like HEAT-repeats domain-containing protein n=1 Tax=Rangifer tarandus platyrhynchus TaxID=3082113 RepID=A0ABN8XT24_RANTA|nr:unnamed protein product [Rangifer tarandus platyrhynchus]
MSSPSKGESCGISMLNLLKTLSQSIAPSMADMWELEIPQLVKTHRVYLEPEAVGEQADSVSEKLPQDASGFPLEPASEQRAEQPDRELQQPLPGEGLCFYYAATCCTVRPPLFCFLLSSRPEANAQKSTGKTLINKIYSAHLASCRTR